MPRYSAEQIYGFARQAGFSPDEAATMTAIALAESGGDSRAHNPTGEDSRGLWQINAQAHPDLARRYNLYDPAQNARAAFEVSRGGDDVSPWTVTHGGTGARYLMYRGNAEAAALAAGDGRGLGVWTGTPGYGRPLPAGRDDGGGDALPGADGGDVPGGDRFPGSGPGPGMPDMVAGGDNPALDRFLSAARDQVGDRYVFGAEVDLDDRNPGTFDCSELTQWAAHQAGATIPDGATAQFRFLRERGMLVPVEQAKNIPGALLFTFDSEPGPTGGEDPGAHVAISTGDGRTIEAANPDDGVLESQAGNRFKYAAVIPGISDGSATPLPGADPAELAALSQLGGPDTDRDGLTDAMETRLGLDPANADTDGDNLPDGYELVTSRSDPLRADSDGDRLDDAFELARGLDPAAPDTDHDGHLDGAFSDAWVDTDADGLDDDLEQVLGLDQGNADTDGDGFADGLEYHAGAGPDGSRLGGAGPDGADPLDPRSTPLRQGRTDPAIDPLRPDDVQTPFN